MAGLTQMTSVSIEFTFPAPRTIFADDDPNDVSGQKYLTKLNPPLDLCREIFLKVLANVQNPANPVKLMIDTDNKHIIRDPSFSVPGPSALQPATTVAATAASAPQQKSTKKVTQSRSTKKKGKRP